MRGKGAHIYKKCMGHTRPLRLTDRYGKVVKKEVEMKVIDSIIRIDPFPIKDYNI